MKPLPPLTDRQAQVLLAIQGRIKRRGAPPTFRELGAALGIGSTNGVSCHLDALIRKGYLRNVKVHGSRCLQVLQHIGTNGQPVDNPAHEGINKAVSDYMDNSDGRPMADMVHRFVVEMSDVFEGESEKVVRELVDITRKDPVMGLHLTERLLTALGGTWRAAKLGDMLRERIEKR